MGILRLELSGNDTRWEPRGLAVVVFWQQGAYGLHMGCVIWAPDYSIHWAKYRVIKKNPCGGGRNACGECSTRNTVGWESCMVSSVLNRAMWQIKERICMWWTSGIVMLYSMWWKYDREGFFSLFPGDKVVVSRDQWMHEYAQLKGNAWEDKRNMKMPFSITRNWVFGKPCFGFCSWWTPDRRILKCRNHP